MHIIYRYDILVYIVCIIIRVVCILCALYLYDTIIIDDLLIILDSDLYNLFGCQWIFLKIGMITNIILLE